MVLSDSTIRAEIESGRLVIDPYDADLVQPSSIDVRLDRYFRVFHNTRRTHIDVREPLDDLTEAVEVPAGEPFVLHPGEFVLGQTLERVGVPDDLVPRLDKPVEKPYGSDALGSKYQGQDRPTASRMHLNFPE